MPVDIEQVRALRTQISRDLRSRKWGKRDHARLRAEGALKVLTEIEMETDNFRQVGDVARDVVADARRKMMERQKNLDEWIFGLVVSGMIIAAVVAGVIFGAWLNGEF